MTVPKFSLVFLGSLGEIGGPVLNIASFAGRPKARLFFKWTEPLMLALACAHECLLGRSVADIMCIKQYTYSMSCARPCALLHDPAFLENLHLLSSSFI